MSLKPATPAALKLLTEGARAMARIEQAGIRIDTDYLNRSIQEVSDKIAEMDAAISDDPIYKLWAKEYGNAMKPGSRAQLGHIVFDKLGYKRNPYIDAKVNRGRETDEEKHTNSVAAFEHLKLPFVRNWQDVERLKKALSTNLKGLLREVVDGYVHPFFNLHLVESYRSQSDHPNLQNQPIRNKDIARIVRTCMIPQEGHVFLEPDLETHEVRISYCYNKDPNLRHDVLTGDMHRDRAMDLFMLPESEITKDTRYTAKNKFVFAQFYGSYYKQCAPELWDYIAILDLRRKSDGVSLYEHLKANGIKRLGRCDPDEKALKGTYEYHVQEVERKMWEERYPVYNQWKKNWWDLYLAQGGINTKTGFCQAGLFRRNQILCDAIQGSAFHCLLWTIIQVQKEFRIRKMRSKIVTQVHDSMLIDAHRNEIEDVVKIVRDIILNRLPAFWDWICIPLGMGFDICEKNWFDKKELKLEGMPA